MAHIFISYSRENVDFARYLRVSLEHEGFPVWMDEKRLSAGMNWWKEIEHSIDTCGLFIVIMSPAADQSMYVQNEILRALDKHKPILPVLLEGQVFSLLATVQYEDMRAGLSAKPSAVFLKNIRQILGETVTRDVQFEIVQKNVLDIECSVLVLKYAKSFHGADATVNKQLAQNGITIDQTILKEGQYQIEATQGHMPAEQVIYIPTADVFAFGYREVREFAKESLRILASEIPSAKHIAMTIHGVRSSLKLDEGETLLAQIAGLFDAIQVGSAPLALEKITIVELDADRVQRLRATAQPFLDEVEYATPLAGDEWGYQLHFDAQKAATPSVGKIAVKPYAVALVPDDAELEDIFFYGIQRPVHAMGLLCERVGLVVPEDSSNDLPALLQHIGDAQAFICDISALSPRMYTMVGYAWGKGLPVALVGREAGDTILQTNIPYDKIWQLEERLGRWLKETLGLA